MADVREHTSLQSEVGQENYGRQARFQRRDFLYRDMANKLANSHSSLHTSHLQSHFAPEYRPPNMTAQESAAAAEQRSRTNIPWKEFEATLLRSLEITSFDLAALEHHLVAAKWVPNSTDEDSIKSAAFRFRQSYESDEYDYETIFSDNDRLSRLFKAWTDEEMEECEMEYEYSERGPKGPFQRTIERETAKYNAIRDLIMHLATRKSRPNDVPNLTDEQFLELLKKNDRARAIFTNNVKKSTDKETKALNQKIAEKDAEIAGMLETLG